MEVENERFVIVSAKAALARDRKGCLGVLSIELEHQRLHVIESLGAALGAADGGREYGGCGEGRQQSESLLERSAHCGREDIPAR